MDADTHAATGCIVDWRVAARDLFPELEAAVGEDWSVHVFFTELLELVREAHREEVRGFTGELARVVRDRLSRGYGFAKWCLDQPRRFLGDAAVVSFYEHLFDDWELRFAVAAWLPDGIAERAWPLWEWRLPVDRLAEVEQLLSASTRRR